MVTAYGCCVGSWTRYDEYVRPKASTGLMQVTLTNQQSISEAYNVILSSVATHNFIVDGKTDKIDALVLLHDDLEIIDNDFERKVKEVFEDPKVAIIGVAGGYGVGSLAWWNADTVGHQLTDSGMLNFAKRTGDVDSLEGSLLIFSAWAMQNLRFDTRFTGFHGYDDISMVANSRGKRVVVADIDTYHHTSLGFDSLESAELWAQADMLFRKKWGFV
jgi:Glycosyltransferase like family